MLHHKVRRTVVICVSLVCAVAVAVRVREVQILRNSQLQPMGRYTPAQMMARAQPLLYMLAPDTPELQVSAHTTEYFTRTRKPVHEWTLQASDASGQHVAFVSIDSDTGDLSEAAPCYPLPLPDSVSPHVLNATEAIEHSEQWMARLAMVSVDRDWFLVRSPDHCNDHGIWQLSWKSEGRLACITMNARGDLISLFDDGTGGKRKDG